MTDRIDVLVPVHSAERPIARLAESVLKASSPVRLVVIAHNVDPDAIGAALGEHRNDARVVVVPFSDGIHSPAGPLRFALERLESPFFMKIDSDDYLEVGAVESWLETQQKFDADIVLPTMRMDGTRQNFPTPPARPFRTTLDPVRDRLAYRTSTMGLMRSHLAAKAFPTAGLVTGEDIAPALRLWFAGGRIAAADPRFPYVVGSDARDRVTGEARTLSADLAFVESLANERFWRELGSEAREGMVVKLLRVQVFGALVRRTGLPLPEDDIEYLSRAVRTLTNLAPRAGRALSRQDADLLAELLLASPQPERIRELAVRRSRYLSGAGLTTRRVQDNFRREAPMRYFAASMLARRRR